MMTISNPGRSLYLKRTSYGGRSKFKSVLFLLSFLSFGFHLIGQNNGSIQDLEQFKSQWMTENNVQSLTPDQYAQMKSEWSETSDPIRQFKSEPNEPLNPQRVQQFKNWQGPNFASGFPVYEITGDAERDQQTYDAKKQLWINKFPALYQKMIPDDGLTVSEREAIRSNELNQNNQK